MTLRLLDPASPPPYRPDRVLVAGASGAGKTTVAHKLAALLELDHIDLDGLYYRPGWQPREEFADDVARHTGSDRWITEWHYPEVAGLLARRAQLLVWLDYSAPVTMTSLLLRTLLRSLHREVLWSGNQEPPLRSVLTDPENILRYGWATRRLTRDSLRELGRRRPAADLDVLRFTRPAALSDWLLGPALGAVRAEAVRPALGRSTDAAGLR
ncbi:zeta toxin family protein [Streptomyces sp. NPDC020141]|uniref:zeta toxin family protein n=1 Tax=Streptomyces sp. NPDC020141 TaxID=3365065 RepID=UPI0037B8022E